jgi:protein-S-isoprenylcysteine O-methyltransferase Ste14
MNENVYRWMALVIFLTGATISMYYRRRADREAGNEKISLKSEGLPLMLALRVGGIALWIGVFAYLINPAWMAWSQVQLPVWLRLSGAALGIVTDGLIYWVFSSLGNNVSPTVVTRRQHQLVTSGPYRWVRHPLYTVGFLSYIAFALLAANWYVAILAVIALILLSLRVPAEEEALIARNGDAYRDYAKRTGRFLPRFG